jgi:hypothetical protein
VPVTRSAVDPLLGNHGVQLALDEPHAIDGRSLREWMVVGQQLSNADLDSRKLIQQQNVVTVVPAAAS